ncbi:MAG: alpha-ketoglutarate-dependent dioxygenase AlkB [Bdellovibrio sp.]
MDSQGLSVQYMRGFYSFEEAFSLYETLFMEIPWQRDEIVFFGKKVQIPRLQCWMGEEGAVYSYSGLKMNPIPFNQTVLGIKKDIEQATGAEFNSVLINLYRDGNDSNGWHADDEKELGKRPVIASLSLGTDRIFQMRHKNSGQRNDLLLEHGSLLVMRGDTQKCWKHQIAKSKKITEPRINLTFRKIIKEQF